MNFFLNIYNDIISESLEIQKPKNGIKVKKYIADSGTMIAKKAICYTFITSKNNKVDVIFKKINNLSENITFYVNNETNINTNERDIEILSGVMYILTQRAKKSQANMFTFHAIQSSNKKDDRYLKNMDFKNIHATLTSNLRQIKQMLDKVTPKFKETQNDVIEAIDNISKTQMIGNVWLMDDIKILHKNEIIDEQLYKQTVQQIKEYIMIWKSNYTKEGFRKTTNRRSNVYLYLMKKYMSNDWEIHIDQFDNFDLIRKKRKIPKHVF